MKHEVALTQARLKTPRAAAIAGIVFSVLLMTSLVLVRLSVPADPLKGAAWLSTTLGLPLLLPLNMDRSPASPSWFTASARRLGRS